MEAHRLLTTQGVPPSLKTLGLWSELFWRFLECGSQTSLVRSLRLSLVNMFRVWLRNFNKKCDDWGEKSCTNAVVPCLGTVIVFLAFELSDQ